MAFNPQLGRGEPAGPARVFVLADALAVDGLRAALAADGRLACVGSLEEAEIVLWDLGTDGARVTPASQSTWSELRGRQQAVVALVADDAAAAHALEQGALGVVQRRIDGAMLSAAILAVRLGLCVLDPRVIDVAEHALPSPPPKAADDDEIDALTSREREVLELLALGLSNKLIADRLDVSVHTIKFHVNGILAKLGADTRTAAVARALRRGLVSI
jgi:DNA-binding NarL/FixJ family response regulator